MPGGQQLLVAGDKGLAPRRGKVREAQGAGSVGRGLHFPRHVLEVLGPGLLLPLLSDGRLAQSEWRAGASLQQPKGGSP